MITPSILIVEDTYSVATAYSELLVLAIDAHVETVSSTEAALESLRGHGFDILIVDLKIDNGFGDDLGGFRVVDESLMLDYFRPVIVVTGYGSVETAKTALRQGVYDFIEKNSGAADRLVKSVSKALALRSDSLLRITNPFSPHTIPTGAAFGGRVAEFQFLEERIARLKSGLSPEHFVIVGQVGIGKTSLLSEFKNSCQARGYAAAMVHAAPFSLNETSSVVVQSLIEMIVRSLPFPQTAFTQLTRYLESVGLSVFGAEIKFSDTSKKNGLAPNAFLFDALTNIWKDVQAHAEYMIILVDDTEHLFANVDLMRTIQQTLELEAFRRTRIVFGFAINTDAWRDFTSSPQGRSVARHFGFHKTLTALSKEETDFTVRGVLRKSGVHFDESLFDKIFSWSGGHPKKIQMIGYQLFNQHFDRRVGVDVWDKAVQMAELALQV